MHTPAGKNLAAYFEILVHLIIWAFILNMIYNGVDSYWADLYKKESKEAWNAAHFTAWKKEHATSLPFLMSFFVLLFKALFFYVNVYFIFPRITRRQWLTASFKVLLNFVLCVLAEYAAFMALDSRYSFIDPQATHRFVVDDFADLLLQYGAVLLFALLYGALRYSILLKSARLSKVTAELALLRNQVNPHFLFNTLNNLYAMAVEKKAPELADSIAQLTHLMRYNIYESRNAHITLEKESAYLKDYIRLQSLRFLADDNISIEYKDANIDPQQRIAPMLLIGFIENAFKHGISLKAHSFIHINLSTADNTIHFTVSNSIHRRPDAVDIKYAGFGLGHTKQLLNWQYPKKHQLEIREENNIFTIQLKVTAQ